MKKGLIGEEEAGVYRPKKKETIMDHFRKQDLKQEHNLPMGSKCKEGAKLINTKKREKMKKDNYSSTNRLKNHYIGLKLKKYQNGVLNPKKIRALMV